MTLGAEFVAGDSGEARGGPMPQCVERGRRVGLEGRRDGYARGEKGGHRTGRREGR